jgi:putative ABC transport system permease protein
MRPFLSLIRLVAWRGLAADPIRSLITVLGVALGVAVVLAVRLANQGILDSFRASLDHVAGRTQLEVRGGDPGLPEELFPLIRATPGVRQAAPVLQALLPVSGRPGEALLVLGVDVLGDGGLRDYRGPTPEIREPLRLLTDPDAILLTERYARDAGLLIGGRLRLATPTGARTFTIRGLLGEAGAARGMEGRVAILDIATAQVVLGKLGRLDRVDLLLEPSADPERVSAALRRVLPAAVGVARPEARSARVEQMLAAFQLNLSVLSLVALFVGMFLVYNTLAVSVARQRRQLGILRAVGVSRRGVLLLIAGEGALIGLAGSLAGVLLGLLLARGALGAIGQTVSQLYAFVRPDAVALPPRLAVEGLLLGTGMATLSAFLPALEAGTATPQDSLSPAALERRHRPWLATAAGIALGVSAWGLAQLPPLLGRPLFGYAAALALLVGAACLCPGALRLSQAALARLMQGRRWIAPRLAAGNLGRSLRRNAVSVGAMVVSLAMLVSVSTMIASFRQTVALWIQQTVQADLYLSPVGRLIRGADARMDTSVLARVRTVEGVAEAAGLRVLELEDGRGGAFRLGGADLDLIARRGQLLFRRGDSAAVLAEARRTDGLVVTEVFAERYRVREGDEVVVPTPAGPRRLRVVGVYYDYATEGGLAVMDVGLFARLWRDAWLNSVIIYLRPDADPAAARDAILRTLAAPEDFLLLSNRALRGRVLEIFDQTFAVTYALEAIALVVASLGVLSTLLTSVLERTREIGTLRSLGFTRGHVQATVLWEAGGMGALANLLGLLTGVALSLILIHVINKQSFGWTIQFGLPARLLAEYGGLTLAASLLAGWWPARKASRLPIAEAVRYE